MRQERHLDPNLKVAFKLRTPGCKHEAEAESERRTTCPRLCYPLDVKPSDACYTLGRLLLKRHLLLRASSFELRLDLASFLCVTVVLPDYSRGIQTSTTSASRMSSRSPLRRASTVEGHQGGRLTNTKSVFFDYNKRGDFCQYAIMPAVSSPSP